MYAFGQDIQVGQVGKKPLLTVLLSSLFQCRIVSVQIKKLISFWQVASSWRRVFS